MKKVLNFDEWNADPIVGNMLGVCAADVYQRKYGLRIETCDMVGIPLIGSSVRLTNPQQVFEVIGGLNQPSVSPRNLIVAAGGNGHDLLLTFEVPITSVSVVSDRYNEQPDTIRLIIIEPTNSDGGLISHTGGAVFPTHVRVLAVDQKFDNAISAPNNLLRVDLGGKAFQHVIIECTTEQEAFDNLTFTRLAYQESTEEYNSNTQRKSSLRYVEPYFGDHVHLLSQEAVRVELKLDSNHLTDLERILATYRENEASLKLLVGNAAEIKRARNELNVKTAKLVEEILTPSQLQRLNEILFQQKFNAEPVSILKLDAVQKELNLRRDQLRKLNAVQEKWDVGLRRVATERKSVAEGEHDVNNSDAEQLLQAAEQMQKTVLAVLTEPQKEVLSSLMGADFDRAP